jgi:hypothetical protein
MVMTMTFWTAGGGASLPAAAMSTRIAMASHPSFRIAKEYDIRVRFGFK